MRQRRVAALALPLPATDGQEVSAVRAVDLECDGRHEGAGFTGALGAAPAGEGLLEELAKFAICVREVVLLCQIALQSDAESMAACFL